MQNKTIYILQDTNERCLELANEFKGDDNFCVVGTSCDGKKALNDIFELNPDFVITELVISGYDGMQIVKEVSEKNSGIKVIVLSALCREEIITKAISLGAKYFFAKPVNFALLKERLIELSKEQTVVGTQMFSGLKQERTALDEKISKIFINVGIPPHIKGYSFLREGVKMAVEDPSIINNITKKLYPMIGERYDTSASKVERAIRHAIEVAWNRGRIESINNILGVRAYVGQEKPTNGEFIAIIADHMLLEKV